MGRLLSKGIFWIRHKKEDDKKVIKPWEPKMPKVCSKGKGKKKMY
jgi:hypothetical protein